MEQAGTVGDWPGKVRMIGDRGPEPTEAELQAEIERLQAENAALRAETAGRPQRRKKRIDWRGVAVWVLVVLGGIMALFTPVAVYAHDTFLDTDNFVATVAPLIKEDAVATAVSDRVSQAFLDGMHVGERLTDQLPDQLDFIATPLINATENFVRRLTQDIITSDNFFARWENVLRTAHSAAVGILRGDRAVEISSQGVVSLDVGELQTNVRDRLTQSGFGFLARLPIPQSSRTIALFQSSQLGALKGGIHLLDILYWLLPLLAFIFFAATILVAKDRRRALMMSGTALAVAMSLSLLFGNLLKTEVLRGIQSAESAAAAQVIWSDLAHNLRALSWGLLALGVVVGGGAAVAGPYRWAAWLRRKYSDMLESWRERRADRAPGRIAIFVSTYAWALRIAGFVIAFLVLIPFRRLTGAAVIWTAAVLLVYLLAIELVRVKGARR